MAYLKLSDLNSYKLSVELSQTIWFQVKAWKWFEKHTIGIQLVRSADSIGANIAEGFGRHHKKDREKFYFNARGSVYETVHWVKVCYKRGLFSKMIASSLLSTLQQLPKELNHLIRFTEENLKT